MSTMCPVCNGLLKTGPRCPCGGEMVDAGTVTDYLGPYSPYFNTSFSSGRCVHLFTCPACGRDSRFTFRLKNV